MLKYGIVMKKTTIGKIVEKIEKAINTLNWPEDVNWQVYASEKQEYGHYATNVAMVLAKKIGKDPMETAQGLCKILSNDFEVKAVAPGFVNFYLDPELLCREWQNMVRELNKQIESPNPQKIQIEFVSANPTGPLTLGNGRGGFLGDVLGNIMKRVGHTIVKEYYINDAGYQVQRLGESVLNYPEASYQGDYIEELRQLIKADNPIEAGQKAADHILETMIRPDVEKIGLKFDVWFSERTLYRDKLVEKVLVELKNKKLTEEKEGALWLKTTEFGDDKNRVLVKATGEMTYLMTDLAYHRNKFERGFDLMIDIWGADHQGHIQPLIQGLNALGHESKKLKILIAQWVKVIRDGQEVTISKRRGEYITIAELVDEVGLDAVRYFFLERSLNSHLNFDFDLAVKKSADNPVYYIQYAHARIQSILTKLNINEDKIDQQTDFIFNHPSELNLIASMLNYPEVISIIAENYEVHQLPQYIYRLASALHQFYRDCPVIGSKGEEQRARLVLLKTVKKILKEALSLMGISAPDKM